MPVKTFFTGIQETILSYLSNAEEEIFVAVAWLTNRVLFDELCKKAKFGTVVKVLILKDEINLGSNCDYEILTINGAQLFWQEKSDTNLMHNKFCIIDQKTVITGSYNWTNRASLNKENITVLEDEIEAAKSYIEEFKTIIPLLDEASFVEKYYVPNTNFDTPEKRIGWFNSLPEKWKVILEQAAEWISWEDKGAIGVYKKEYTSFDEKLSGMLRLKYVTVSDNINELSGLIHLSDLETLYIDNRSKNITDLSPLKNLVNLKNLDISISEISDISPLQNLRKLRCLGLSSRKLRDIHYIENLKKITNLAFVNCEIDDISCATKMYNLRLLNFKNNKVADLSSLSEKVHLEWLDFDNNEVQDISILSGCKNLNRLSMQENRINDISALKECAKLEQISCNNNQIEDILSLVNLKKLKYLLCLNNPLDNGNIDLFRKKSKAFVY